MDAAKIDHPILGGLSIATRALYLAITVQCALGLLVAGAIFLAN